MRPRTCPPQQIWTPRRIQALRRRRAENVRAFASHFARSGRTIEDWEQSRRTPDELCCRILDRLAAELGPTDHIAGMRKVAR